MQLSELLALIINGTILLLGLLVLIAWFAYGLLSWVSPTRLRELEIRRIEAWPIGRNKSQRIAQVKTDTWITYVRMATAVGGMAIIGFVIAFLLQIL